MGKRLLDWYRRAARDLPWRRRKDPYAVWVSEIMLQQTRASAVVPYYNRFLERFPDPETLARASEQELLEAWAGLGYYSRARNLLRAARLIVAGGGFPRTYPEILALPGVGAYTAAAVASIAFGLPHPVLDSNVVRVMSRLTGEEAGTRARSTRARLLEAAATLVAGQPPGDANQALMELGALVCLPQQPLCPLCPLAAACQAKRMGRQQELPRRAPRAPALRVEKTLLWIERRGSVLLWQRPPQSPKLAGFWELPEAADLPQARPVHLLAHFRHTITRTRYLFHLVEGRLRHAPPPYVWARRSAWESMPLSTVTRKAMSRVGKRDSPSA